MHPRGAYNLFIFRMDDGAEATVTSYVAANTEQYTDTDGSVINMLSIPSSSILDGVVSCDRDIVTRPLPTTVDRGLFQVSGCHSGEFAKRKIVNGAPIDTNNTTYDFEMLKYQTPSYGAGWRD